MPLSKQMWIGLGVVAAGVGGYLLWPKKASAASGVPVTTTPKGTTAPPTPAVWTAPPVPPPGWTLPPGWIPPAGWVPPWTATAPSASSIPGWLKDIFGSTPVTPAGAATVSDDYKAGFNAGMMDAAIYPGKSMTPIAGSNQNSGKYASSPSYKSGYDQGWHDYMSSVTTAGVRGLTAGATVGAGMPEQWWGSLPRATPQDYGMCHPETSMNPWRG